MMSMSQLTRSNVSIFDGASHVQINNDAQFNVAGRNQINYTGGIHNHYIETPQETEARKVAEWLTPLNSHPVQSQKLALRAPGSGEWFLNSDGFRGWLESEPSTLWCPGIPGAGKSVIASIVINHLQEMCSKEPGTAIIFVYCNYKEKITLLDIISSLLRQLVLDYNSAERIEELYSKHLLKGTRPQESELMAAFLLELSHYSKLFIAVDALDECDQDSCFRLVKFLEPLKTAHIFFTSRDLGWLNTLLNGTRRVDIYANERDLRTLIEKECNESLRLTIHLGNSIRLKYDMILKLIEKAKGMFLLTKLHMVMLAAAQSSDKFQETLDDLPGGIDGAYDESVGRILAKSDDDRDLAIEALVWITQALRPLTFKELQEALTVLCPSRGFVEEGVLDSVCAGLIRIERETGVVRLIHYTAQEYFKIHMSKLAPSSSKMITTACLKYLSSAALNHFLKETHLPIHSFLGYAAWHWGSHARLVQDDISILEDVNVFLSDGPASIFALQVLLTMLKPNHAIMAKWRDSLTQGVSSRFPLVPRFLGFSRIYPTPGRYACAYLKAYFGLYRLFTIEDAKLDIKAVLGFTPLHLACAQGYTDFVKVLLDFRWGILYQYRVDINSRNIHDKTALILGIEGRHFDVVNFLLSRPDLDVNIQDRNKNTALMYATDWGNLGVVKLLLSKPGLDTNLQNTTRTTALMWVAEKGNSEMTTLLLSRPDLDINLREAQRCSALMFAVQGGNSDQVKVLLSRPDLDVNLQNLRKSTALMWAAAQGDFNIVKLLLSRPDLNVNLRDKEETTALIIAAQCGHSDVVELLLSRADLDVNLQDSDKDTALIKATVEGYSDVVKLLLSRPDLDVNLQGSCRNTALLWATWRRHSDVVKLLLSRPDLDIDLRGQDDCTALEYATVWKYFEIVKYLKEVARPVDDQKTEGEGYVQ